MHHLIFLLSKLINNIAYTTHHKKYNSYKYLNSKYSYMSDYVKQGLTKVKQKKKVIIMIK